MFGFNNFTGYIKNTGNILYNYSKTYSKKLYDNISYFCVGNYKGIKSLYLFINIIYNVNNIINNDRLESDYHIDIVKQKIMNCGCIGIKFSQWIISKLKGLDNNKYDYIIKKFDDIFDNCNYHDLSYTKQIFEYDLKRKFDNIIDNNNLELIGSGSIGQVYKTRFKKINNNNLENEIVIKVRHPYTDYITFYQMILIYCLILIQKIDYFKNKYYLHFNLNEFINNINKQIDFNIEAFNCIEIGKKYKDNEYVVIPKVHNFSKNILILSHEYGIDIDEITEYQKCKVALNMLCFIYNMALVDNFMHGDLHIKNWKVRKYKKTYQLVIYDFGICFKGPSIKYNRKAIEYCETRNIKKLIELFLDDNNEYNTDENRRTNLIDKLYNTFNSFCNEPFNMIVVFNNLIYVFSTYNLIINNLFMNIMLYFCLLEETFKKTNIICNDQTLINHSNNVRNQKLDIITFCNTYNVYPDLKKLFENQINITNNNKIKNVNQTKFSLTKDNNNNNLTQEDLFATIKLSNFNFDNPDDFDD